MKKSKAQKLIKVIEQWARAEIMARHAPFNNLEYINYAIIKVEKEDRIRKIAFGTSNLVELGIEWGLLKPERRKRKKE